MGPTGSDNFGAVTETAVMDEVTLVGDDIETAVAAGGDATAGDIAGIGTMDVFASSAVLLIWDSPVETAARLARAGLTAAGLTPAGAAGGDGGVPPGSVSRSALRTSVTCVLMIRLEPFTSA